ncbi:glycosyltransferase [Sphingobacterium alkalisoli]|uniref:Glycosyltransferase n=1 Tax=Sphingobacterium alkalisoli TaxID=1874115 RepID=A0A4U0H7I5_9SPHI|nr:glycosyltransferase [Sphingobacterium alkalisoli]TJY67711.1 glycosyltransferase [Sphingobacterium alkalisoli]GGH11837.1 hypothetical protein GCM10011418_10980 [Sphingobacterium alkalisoli]
MINLYIIDYFNQKSSGLTTYVDQLREYILKDKRINLHFIFVRATSYTTVQKEKIGNSVHYYIPHDIGPSTTAEQDKQFIDFLRKDIREKQVIFHFNWINHAPFAQVLKKAFRCKIVLTKHCIPWRDFITANYPLFRILNKQFLSEENPTYLDGSLIREQLTYHALDHIICVTELARNSLDKLFCFPMDKVSVIYNGLLPRKANPQLKEKLKSKYGFSLNERIVLYAGAVNERKGVYDLVATFDKVLQQIDNVRLVIAGTGDFGAVFKSTDKNWAKITLTGNLDKNTLYDFYQIADVGVVPSYIEQCSYTTIEMMHHELPLIVADVDGLAEIVPDDGGLKVPLVLEQTKAYIHQDKLAEYIVYLLENPEIARQYAHKSKQHALKNLSVKKMVTETIQVYDKLFLQNESLPANTDRHSKGELVSVLLPCHNGEKYLNACIDSVLKQTYPQFELIVVNDGSTDKTREIVEKYDDERIRLINYKQNVGIVDSLNHGIKEAKGKYIARIDADDMMHPDRLHKQIQYLENQENQDVGLVGSHHYVINSIGKITSLKQYPITNNEINATLLFHNPFSHPSVMMRADVVKKIKYSNQYPHVEDYHLWFNILKKHKAGNIPEYLTYYRVHDNSLSVKSNKDQKENAADLVLTELEQRGVDPTVENLKIHIAILQGYRGKFFNTKEKVELLQKWITSILEVQQGKHNYSDQFSKNMKKHILQMYCNIYE